MSAKYPDSPYIQYSKPKELSETFVRRNCKSKFLFPQKYYVDNHCLCLWSNLSDSHNLYIMLLLLVQFGANITAEKSKSVQWVLVEFVIGWKGFQKKVI